MISVTAGLLLPLAGTALGATGTVFVKKRTSETGPVLSGFAAGVMVAASVWSLIVPSIEASARRGAWCFVPAAVGIWLGAVFLLVCEGAAKRIETRISEKGVSDNLLLIFAVVLHNIPEGIAVGLAFASYLAGGVSFLSALMLSTGIAIQNIPEGAIISMPLAGGGMKRKKAVFMGLLSGVVEPVFSLVTLALSTVVTPLFPYLLGFAAGAMLYVCFCELIPSACKGERAGTCACFLGFTLMMALDVFFS